MLPDNFVTKTRPSTCIVWTGALNSRGYGCFGINGVSQLAHRVAYEACKGPIPEGMTIDHLCGFRRCVNPDHLEPVSAAENCSRAARVKEVCDQGHPLVQRRADGKRYCRVCTTIGTREAKRAEYALVSIGAGGASSAEVRAWAKSAGLAVNDRGNLPVRIRRAYVDAHPTP